MKKLIKRDYLNLSILIGFILLFIFILFLTGHLFISEIDYTNQHMIYPDYFRKIFLETGKLFPSFAFNLGMGENIFYFSYYGLFSPFIVLSYILPFIPMYIYIPLISIFSLILSVFIFYKWINDKYNSNVALIVSILFLLNSTFFYHFHRHIMFSIYMPFLLLSLNGVDLFFKKKKILPLIINISLMILTNYYFGAYGVIFISVYGIYSLLKSKKFDFRKFLKFIYLEIIAILITGLLLLPTLHALLNGRIDTTIQSLFSFGDLFKITKNFDYTFYSSYYSWGLIFIYIISLIHAFKTRKKANIFLGVILALIIIFPIFSYILNGFMYIDGKCYLPFLPVIILLVSDFVNDFKNNKFVLRDNIIYILIASIILIFAAFKSDFLVLLIIDIIITCLFLNRKFKNPYLNFIPVIIISLVSFIISSCNEAYLKVQDYKKINNVDYSVLSKFDDNYRMGIIDNKLYTVNQVYDISSKRTSVYSSLVNKNYFNLFRNVFENEILNRDNYVLSEPSNLLFNIYASTKYLITSNECPFGYTISKKLNNKKLCLNNDVLPISYITDRIISLDEFKTLNYPYNIDALLNYAVVDKKLDNNYDSNIIKYDLKYDILNKENFNYKVFNNHYLIDAKNTKVSLKINDNLENKILFIKFKMNKMKEGFACSSNITINGVTNALSCDKWKYHNKNYTFEYVFGGIDTLNISFSNDSFDLSDFEFYLMDYDKIKEIKNNVLNVDLKLVNDNTLLSKVNVDKKGILKLTIPYEEKGFKVFVDDLETEIFKVDDAFIGFNIDEGMHDIKITFDAPLLKEGKILSLIGLILLSFTILFEKFKIAKK